jgi:hypothetical protein
VRAALDSVGHPALLLVDTVSSLASTTRISSIGNPAAKSSPNTPATSSATWAATISSPVCAAPSKPRKATVT